jgi:hypothetical protein
MTVLSQSGLNKQSIGRIHAAKGRVMLLKHAISRSKPREFRRLMQKCFEREIAARNFELQKALMTPHAKPASGR